MDELLCVQRASRTFGRAPNEVLALDEVDLTVRAGEMVAVMGPSGSGKSTLLGLVGGLERPDGGQVIVDGADLSLLSPADLATVRRRRIGLVFQQFNLLAGLTAVENVAAPLELDGQSQRAARTEAAALLDRVGLGSRLDAFPDDLSGGEQQRVAIARALTGERTIILADEPTGALDRMTGRSVIELLRSAASQGLAVVVVTHDHEIAALTDRIVHLRDGRLDPDARPGAEATGVGAGIGTAGDRTQAPS